MADLAARVLTAAQGLGIIAGFAGVVAAIVLLAIIRSKNDA